VRFVTAQSPVYAGQAIAFGSLRPGGANFFSSFALRFQYARVMSLEMSRRTCPWCGVTQVYALSEERLTITLTDHLKVCDGEGGELPGQEEAG
jgi:hypothetical protein